MTTATLTPDLDKLKQICEKHHVRKLRVFGSVSKGEARAQSDVDLFVDYELDYTPTFLSMSQLDEDLSAMFDGREVDLIRTKDLHWFIRRSVLASARTLYER